jgi:hypothetical protein
VQQTSFQYAAPRTLFGARHLNDRNVVLPAELDCLSHDCRTTGAAKIPGVFIEQAMREKYDAASPILELAAYLRQATDADRGARGVVGRCAGTNSTVPNGLNDPEGVM